MSQILALASHQPIKGERYFIDTNVWFWATYVASKTIALPQHPERYQLEDYPRFLEEALDNGAKLCHCPLTLAELANIIEKTEWDIYKKHINDAFLDKKAFRKIPTERKNVLNEIQVAWDTINGMSTCIDVALNSKFATQSCTILAEGSVDAFDAFFVQTMRNHNIDYVVSDDYDFSTIHQQILITANRKATKKTN